MIPFPEEHARSRRTQVGPEPAGLEELAIHVVQGWADSLLPANPASMSVGNPTRDCSKTYREVGSSLGGGRTGAEEEYKVLTDERRFQ